MLILVPAACAPPGQRLFDASADKSPTPLVKAKPTTSAVAPFLQFPEGTPEEVWAPVVTKTVKLALLRKPGVLFQVQGICPAAPDLKRQQDEMHSAVNGTLREMMTVMRSAGVDSSQIMLSVRTSSNEKRVFFRIDPK